MRWNISPARWVSAPLPLLAMVMAPGLDLASATSSARLLAFTFGLTAITEGMDATMATGAKPRSRSKAGACPTFCACSARKLACTVIAPISSV